MTTDPASCAINAVICAMKQAFAPDTNPAGGGSEKVRFFAGDASPLAAWNAHVAGPGCSEPFLWVRLMRRYRSEQFPVPFVEGRNCPLPRVIAVEVGAGRCAVMDPDPSWEEYQREAEISLDDSWRIELALCRAGALATQDGCADQYATDSVIPFGPEGGIIAWLGTMYLGLG